MSQIPATVHLTHANTVEYVLIAAIVSAANAPADTPAQCAKLQVSVFPKVDQLYYGFAAFKRSLHVHCYILKLKLLKLINNSRRGHKGSCTTAKDA